jgi:choline kinase
MSVFKSTIWDGTSTSVSILVPTRDTVYSHFSYSLTNLMKTSTQMGIDVHLFFNASTILINQREQLIDQAIQIKSDWVLWLDSDMVFPSTTLLRLLSHNQNIVACNYMKRSNPMKSVAFMDISDWESWVPLQKQDELLTVEAIGMGCVLIKTEIFNQLKKPYFEYTYDNKTQDWLGEDFTLFKKINYLGYEVKVDTNLSNEIYHIGSYAFGKNVPENIHKKNK